VIRAREHREGSPVTIRRLTQAATALACGVGLLWPAVVRAAPAAEDFSLGVNAESQVCRAVAIFDTPKGAHAADIYCGAWERPSGRVTVFDNEALAKDALAAVCKGDETALQSADFSALAQIGCRRTGADTLRRFALVARHGAEVAVGEVYPSDWAPMVGAARVLMGLEKPAAAATANVAQTPGLREIEAVFPAGPPGQSAAFNFELLRRRAYEYNSIWDFAAAERDFEALLQAQQRIAPDDVAGEADILSEVGLNMSGARRFDEAGVALQRAEALARSADDALLLVSKVQNYEAIDQLNQRRFAAAFRLALAANQIRAALVRAGESGVGAINAADVRDVEGRPNRLSRRGLMIELSDTTPADQAAVLEAQGEYVAGVAARELKRSDAAEHLNAASAALQSVGTPPARLVSDIANERANLDLAAHAYSDAAGVASAGLTIVRTVAPGTRSEAHLWLALESAQAGAGQTADALASGRAAVGIYATQTESPGLPPEVAVPHMALLEQQWLKTGDPALAAEYFQVLALAWDGTAARTASMLAARLALRDAGPQARAFQDADRAYRAAFARRQTLAGETDVTPGQISEADAAIQKSAADLAAAEADLRSRAPAYLELLSPQVAAADLQSVLAEKEAYLRIVMTSAGGFGALVDKTGVHPFPIALSDAEVDALVDRLRRTTRLKGRRLPDYDLTAARALYDALLGPVKDRLAGDTDLDVDVSGSLASIPFGALVATPPSQDQLVKVRDDQDYSGIDWLARHVTVVNALGPAAFIRLRREPPKASAQLSAVAYGDFVPDARLVATRLAAGEGLSDACRAEVQRSLALYDALPDTADEARSVAASFTQARVTLGPAFTDADFLHDPHTAKADVILLATHGVLALSPCFPQPALLTSVGDHGLGVLEASDLLDQQLTARLVVLSACDTAAGAKLDEASTGLDEGGDALSGLARAFIYAGARDVMATEWKVDAAASKAEITSMLTDAIKPGARVRDALAAAESKLYDQAETGHPFYWAAFILVGDGGGQLNTTASVADAAP
jgi:CHAT domain-containing protein